MTRLLRLTTIFTLVFAAAAAEAQQRPAIRQLGAVTARASEPVGQLVSIRALTSGSVLVNDFAGRRVLLFDPTLAAFTVVADSTSATGNAYSGRIAGLVAYHGDSTLFVDPMSMSMMVIDPAGKLGRVMSVPRSQDAMTLAGGMLGSTGFDPRGALIYRGSTQLRQLGGPPAAGGVPATPELPDSAAIVRVDLATRRLDTLAFFRIPKLSFNINRRDDGTMEMTSQINPLPIVDDWAALPDGSIAIVRGSDYRVDYVSPDGTVRSAPKIPFDWQRLTDEDKVAFIDSVKVARERMQAAGSTGGVFGIAGGTSAVVQMRTGGPPGGGTGGGGAAPGASSVSPQISFIDPEQLPDYKPAFLAGSTRADNDGRLWVRTVPTHVIPGGPVYDVIDREGRLIDRVQVPEGRTIVGFGDGVVYLAAHEGDKTILERAALR